MLSSSHPIPCIDHQDFISLQHFQAEELEHLLSLASAMKSRVDQTPYLAGQNIGLLFANPSTRTRVSFQVAVSQLGGHAEQLIPENMHMGVRENVIDTAKVLSGYLDALILRTYNMERYGEGRTMMELFAKHSDIPIINALDDKDHPCQTMADLLTLQEHFAESYKQKRIVLTWAYSEREQSLGVAHSMLTAAALLGLQLTIVHPEGYDLEQSYIEHAANLAATSGAKIDFSHNLQEAVEGASVIYAKNWKSLHMTQSEERQLKATIRHDWCVTNEHFERALADAIYMDCMPFTRGHQVTADVADGPQSVIYQQAENRLHVQKAILASLPITGSHEAA